MTYKISRYWNRIAYFVMKIGWKMIWDHTGRNQRILNRGNVFSCLSEAIMCERTKKG